jgi:hypothetical protein
VKRLKALYGRESPHTKKCAAGAQARPRAH